MEYSELDSKLSIQERLTALLSAGDHPLTILSNSAAFIVAEFERLNWAGFYLFDGSQLILGPFCGKPACTTIALGRGVCGTAAKQRETIVVADVDAFPGHIACDGASRSEIVMPMIGTDGSLIGVFDVDSPDLARFSEADQTLFEALRDIVVECLAGRPILAS
jgi:L-methionine (R)-S-oxide reductase